MCAREARQLQGVDWPTCPTRAVLEHPAVGYIARLYRDSKRAPLAQWPQRYAAWVPAALEAYARSVEGGEEE